MLSNVSRTRFWLFGCAGLAIALLPFSPLPASAQSTDPIRIGVIGEESSVAGASLTKAAAMAADDINAHGGVNGRKIEVITYDNHSSSADSVRAFQRAVSQDKVVAVIGSYISEVVLALEPWSARLHMPFITPGAASNLISKAVHDDYDHYKYTFHGWLTSAFIAQAICDYTKDMLVGPFHMKTAVVMSEDAAWTTPLDAGYLECLPKAGLKVLDHIRFNPDTADFTPIFHQIEDVHPDVIITGISHVGVQPTVQWHDQQVPIADGRTKLAGHHQHVLEGHQWRRRRRRHRHRGRPRRGAHALHNPFRRGLRKEVRCDAGLRRIHRLRHGPRHCRSDRACRRLDRSRQARHRARGDRSCGNRRPHTILWPRQPIHPRASNTDPAWSRPSLFNGRTASRCASGRPTNAKPRSSSRHSSKHPVELPARSPSPSG